MFFRLNFFQLKGFNKNIKIYSPRRKISIYDMFKCSLSVEKTFDSHAKLEIVSNGFWNTPKSLMISTVSNRYLINCGEGTQRIANTNGLKINKIDHILLTREDWGCIGGLNSLSKELSEERAAKYPITFHSPHTLNANHKKSLINKKMQHISHDYNQSNCFEDKYLRIKIIPLKSNNLLYYSYLITLKRHLPSLNTDKLNLYKLKPGPWIGKLKQGIDYVSPEGIIVKSADVLNYDNSTDRNILILDMPNIDCLYNIIEDNLINYNELSLIAHISDNQILNHSDYFNWIDSFKQSKCINLVMDETKPNVDLSMIYEVQAQLNLIDNEIFPLLPAQQDEFKQQVKAFQEKEKEIQNQYKVVYGLTGMSFQIQPDFKLSLSDIQTVLENEKYQKKIFEYYEEKMKLNLEEIDQNEKQILEELREKKDSYKKQSVVNASPNKEITEDSNNYPIVLFLGTSSAIPSAIRNLSGILVKTTKDSSILLDCGEHTIGQLKKFYGENQFDEELTKLKAIFISHNHLDHFSGIYSIIERRIKAFNKLNRIYENIFLIYPFVLYKYLTFLNEYGQIFKNSILLQNDFMVKNENESKRKRSLDSKNIQDIDKLKETLCLSSIFTIPVDHIYQSYGLFLDIRQKSDQDNKNFSIVYSGDTRPTENLLDIGKNCDLLIHECTFDNQYFKEAIENKHSTISEAIQVSQHMNAKWTLLTHFSTRYGRVSVVNDVNEKNVGFSFDFMQLTSKNVEKINAVLPQLKVVFKEYADIYEKVKQKNKLI